MQTPQQLLDAIHALPLHGPLRILHLSGDQERAIARAGIREALPTAVELRAGPGCAASICPPGDIVQAIRLAQREALTLLVGESLLRLPAGRPSSGVESLATARDEGADIRVVSAPVEAVLLAREDPGREMVLFLAGFETLLAPLAGLLLQGFPRNLSLLLCGRDVQPLLRRALECGDPGFDALLLPGNRCALIGSTCWESLTSERQMPAAVSGYTASAVLRAILAVVRQASAGQAGVENCYRPIARSGGNAVAQAQMREVYRRADGDWRGFGRIPDSAFRLQQRFRDHDADCRFPDYREAGTALHGDMPPGCECAAVLAGRMQPQDCSGFARSCRPPTPYGPCMASPEGTCQVNEPGAAQA